MLNILAPISQQQQFYGHTNPLALAEKYGTPLYVYNETILRQRCRELKQLITYPHFVVQYSMKANSNLTLLRLIREEGVYVDTISPGEIYVALQAGFTPAEILYVGNNVSAEEMQFAIDRQILVSVDSLAQLARYGQINGSGRVAVRFNPDVGAGHHEKVVTGGKKTKFGVERTFIPEVQALLKQYQLQLVGINQHIGSLFLDGAPYVAGIQALLDIVRQFDNLEFVDFGGGFGIPYHKQDGEARLDLRALGQQLDEILADCARAYGREVTFKIEPGRYLVAESSILLGTVQAVKMNHGIKYIGTDVGFNVLKRPVMYDSHHDIEVYRPTDRPSKTQERVTVVGNICETGDILAKNRRLPEILEGDVLGIMDAGAYGFAMASTYNNRLRPAEVLITAQGEDVVIRQRETFADLVRNFM